MTGAVSVGSGVEPQAGGRPGSRGGRRWMAWALALGVLLLAGLFGPAAARAETKLTASDGAANDELGQSVAVSGDMMVVGAYGATVDGRHVQGAAYVFVKSGGTWTQQAKLTASDGAADDNLGRSVAVSGSTVVVGAPYAHSYQGAAYVFEGF